VIGPFPVLRCTRSMASSRSITEAGLLGQDASGHCWKWNWVMVLVSEGCKHKLILIKCYMFWSSHACEHACEYSCSLYTCGVNISVIGNFLLIIYVCHISKQFIYVIIITGGMDANFAKNKPQIKYRSCTKGTPT